MRAHISDAIEAIGFVAVGVGAFRLNADWGLVIDGALAVVYAFLVGQS
jgi:hypothetical protein